jgi:hypothetical protein
MEPQYGRLKPPPEQVETGQVTLCRALGWWRNAHLSWSIAEGFVVGQLVQVGTLTKRPENPSKLIAAALQAKPDIIRVDQGR